ncbi:MAG: 50S ribosomal protein L6 [Zetaproteobacteria bacterium]|mgnify:CR=1 FL=1|nr:50S ribosomal protein L6 [Pseudobdellovibrionaceae bacterium]|tara:strand:+ start:270 stop:815 length:546 start_codon:yes stop_codon:yes gene_type:complete
MSRIGIKPITIPQGVEVTLGKSNDISVKGPKGVLQRTLHKSMELKKEDNTIKVMPLSEGKDSNFHGLTRTLVNNMILGVSEGFSKSLKLIGVGYRAAVAGKNINLTVGYSHPVVYSLPDGIEAKVEEASTKITISGPNKETVGQVAANIRAYRKPEPYHGKGIRYADEKIITKVGKSGAKK